MYLLIIIVVLKSIIFCNPKLKFIIFIYLAYYLILDSLCLIMGKQFLNVSNLLKCYKQ